MNFLAIIPARYASTRFPGKPLARLGGKPVIQRVYEQVAGVLDDAVVATDDERIRDAVRAFGGRVEMTSPDHRSGTDRCWEAYCKQGREYDVVVNVQGDEPFIRPSQLEAVKRCFDDPATDIATLVKPFTEADGLAALENPNSPKVVLDAQSRAIYFSRSVIPYLRGVPREEWLARHTFYKHIGLYAFRADVLRAVTALPQSPLELAESLEQLRWLENGYKIGVGISEVETIGIDTPEDLEKAERFLQLKIKNEELNRFYEIRYFDSGQRPRRLCSGNTRCAIRQKSSARGARRIGRSMPQLGLHPDQGAPEERTGLHLLQECGPLRTGARR